jgi:hypothetical protein
VRTWDSDAPPPQIDGPRERRGAMSERARDPRNGGDADALPHKLPDTCTAKTGGGGRVVHIYGAQR